jgi:hypothetical protein
MIPLARFALLPALMPWRWPSHADIGIRPRAPENFTEGACGFAAERPGDDRSGLARVSGFTSKTQATR